MSSVLVAVGGCGSGDSPFVEAAAERERDNAVLYDIARPPPPQSMLSDGYRGREGGWLVAADYQSDSTAARLCPALSLSIARPPHTQTNQPMREGGGS